MLIKGGFIYKDLYTAQHQDTLLVFKEFLSVVSPKRILEIGTFHGGLTLMIRDIMDQIGLNNSIIRTYDINDQKFLKPFAINKNIEILTKNLFNDQYSDWKSNTEQKEIADFIMGDGVTIVLCDGGCKKCEFKLIAPLIKNNDIIMAHDYAPNQAYFNEFINEKIWNWHEINDNDIEECCSYYGLLPYYENKLLSVVWVARKKHD